MKKSFLKKDDRFIEKECPKCGYGIIQQQEYPKYEKGIVEKQDYCWNCGDYRKIIETRELLERDKINCVICLEKYLPDKKLENKCNECKEEKIVKHTNRGQEFGLILPKETDVVFKHQTKGIMCDNVFIEGVYIPLTRPMEYRQFIEKNIDLLSKLRKANYKHDNEKTRELWKKIDSKLEFEYRELETDEIPEEQPDNQEGLKWVEITSVEDSMVDDLKNLDGKTVPMIYPNSD